MSRAIRGSGLRKVVILSTALMMLLATSAWAQNLSINTIPSWDGSQSISSFGVTNTATYGETITVSVPSVTLNSFSFEIGNCSANVTFRGSVYAWDGTKATGPSLYQSAAQTVTAGATYTLVTFNAGGLVLPAGNYVLFASTSQDQTGAPSSSCRWGAIGNNTAYPGGQFVYINNGTDTTQWTSTAWNSFTQDLAFSVNAPAATAVPAASTTSLLIGFAALAAMGLYLQSRRRQEA